MKKVSLIALLVQIFAISVFARTPVQPGIPQDLRASNLKEFEISPFHNFLAGVDQGFVVIKNNSIELNLYESNPCPPDAFCILAFLKTFHKTFEITDVEVETCNETVYHARLAKSEKPHGINEKIKVIDYSTSHCEIAYKHLTHVGYKTFDPDALTEDISFFFGGPLTSYDDLIVEK